MGADDFRPNLGLKPGDWVYNHGFAHASRRKPGVVFDIKPYEEGGFRGGRAFDWVEFVIPGYGTSRGARRNFTIIPAELVDRVVDLTDEQVWKYLSLRMKYNQARTLINEANSGIEAGTRMDPIPQKWFDAAHETRKMMESIIETTPKEI